MNNVLFKTYSVKTGYGIVGITSEAIECVLKNNLNKFKKLGYITSLFIALHSILSY